MPENNLEFHVGGDEILKLKAVSLVNEAQLTDSCSLVSKCTDYLKPCWYFKRLYQVNPPAISLDARGVTILVPDPHISREPPTLSEVSEAISRLKVGKPAGSLYLSQEDV